MGTGKVPQEVSCVLLKKQQRNNNNTTAYTSNTRTRSKQLLTHSLTQQQQQQHINTSLYNFSQQKNKLEICLLKPHYHQVSAIGPLSKAPNL